VPDDVVERLWDAIDADPETTVVVDVERLTVEVPSIGLDTSFALDAATQRRFLDGLDDIGITLGYEADIARYEHERAARPA